ncbi:hypothetical protein QWZ04_23130 [Vibrio tapetis subsp. quintayensis]|uniref:hypothetical protein n=1 Tax=Vibrio tapetis TaxID=52443 RepID=UPI0025B297E5|nr:hypothetical protein [Vibrio tapetis]MDN3683204.1 hypothetical protein [Vibrio tapetis subsp. quintayensis]
MKNIPFIATLSATILFSGIAEAKVTYADALADEKEAVAELNRQYEEKLKDPLATEPLQANRSPTQTSDWRTIYSGRTTGSISIPSGTKQIYVVTDGEVVTFPANAPSFIIDDLPYGDRKHIYVRWNGHSLSGSTVNYSYSYDCRGGEHTCWRNASSAIAIKQVMIK